MYQIHHQRSHHFGHLKYENLVAKKMVKANNVEHSDKMSTCENVEKSDGPKK